MAQNGHFWRTFNGGIRETHACAADAQERTQHDNAGQEGLPDRLGCTQHDNATPAGTSMTTGSASRRDAGSPILPATERMTTGGAAHDNDER